MCWQGAAQHSAALERHQQRLRDIHAAFEAAVTAEWAEVQKTGKRQAAFLKVWHLCPHYSASMWQSLQHDCDARAGVWALCNLISQMLKAVPITIARHDEACLLRLQKRGYLYYVHPSQCRAMSVPQTQQIDGDVVSEVPN